MKTTVINLFGGPGCGKSTTAADLFAKLKAAGKNVELVREYVKDWAYEGRKIGALDQLYILGKQTHKEGLLYGKVDYIITDSPILLGPFYESHYNSGRTISKEAAINFLERAAELGVIRHNYVLQRHKPYVPIGRYETEDQAKQIDVKLKEYLDLLMEKYILLDCEDKYRAQIILSDLGIYSVREGIAGVPL